MKMKALTYTSYKEYFELYTEYHGSIAVNSFYIEREKKDEIRLLNETMILYSAESDSKNKSSPIKPIISTGTYSINDYNAKSKVVFMPKNNTF